MNTDTSDWTLVELVRKQATRYGEREFISFEQGGRLSFGDLDRDSDNQVRRLANLGVGPGDRVLGLIKNRVELLLPLVARLIYSRNSSTSASWIRIRTKSCKQVK